MLYRKIAETIRKHLKSASNKVLIVKGARQIGKSFIVRHVGKELFPNYVEINLLEDSIQEKLFERVRTVEDFYLQISMIAGDRLGTKKDTLIFLDEIQEYPHLLAMLKFLQQDGKFTYIASGSLLGVTLFETPSIPIGSIELLDMYPLDLEEFLIANGFGQFAIDALRKKFERQESLDENVHNKLLDLFKKYLFVGGLPDAVNIYLETKNVVRVRKTQSDIQHFYGADASKYDKERKLKIKRIYDMIPSNMESKKKRIVIKEIEDKKGKRYDDYQDEFDYLINAGITLEVKAISTPKFPLIESSGKNLLKLYLNDVGILTNVLYQQNIRAIMDDVRSINLGSVYENVVASELKAHGHHLFYYDNKTKGEVDYLIDDYDSLSVVPIEVKSGKDYTIHCALNRFVENEEYAISKAYVFSNKREIKRKGKIIYAPIYSVMFL